MDPHSIQLHTTADLHKVPRTSRQIRAELARGELVRIRPGVYAVKQDWSALQPEGRAILRARAYALVAESRPAFCDLTAAALHGWPHFRVRDDRVHTVVEDVPRRGAAQQVARHRRRPDASDLVEIGGLLCTSTARTVADVARNHPAETSLPIADAALHAIAWNERSHSYDAGVAGAFTSSALDHVRIFGRGVMRASRILDFADGRADRPGESVSRLYLAQLGFAPPRLQVPVAGPDHATYWVDFALDDVGAFGEFDGVGKYTDPAMLRGRSPQRAVLEEKRREDWIRGTTQLRVVRWEMEHIQSADHLKRRLAAFSIVPPST